MTHYLFILLGAVLVNNVVLVKILGLCPFMGVSKKLETAFGMGAATTFVLTVATGASYIIDHYLLIPFGLEYLRTLSFIVTIAAIVQLTEMVIQKTSPVLHQVLGIYLPLITTNCAVLGVPLLNIANKNNFVESLLFGAGSAVGFSLVLVLFAGIRERVEGADVPVYFKGVGHRHGHRRPDVAGLHGLCRSGPLPMITAIAIMALGAIVLGAALGYASIKFKVEGDPLVEKIEAILPQTQCGQCGYPGCSPYAEAITKGEADINLCPPGGMEGVRKLADLLGREVKPLEAEEKPKAGCRSLTSRPASAARCASRPARSMPSSAPPSRCTPSSPTCAPAASCAFRPARSSASRCRKSPRTSTTGSGNIRSSRSSGLPDAATVQVQGRRQATDQQDAIGAASRSRSAPCRRA